jgi:hypothetical protein
MGSAETKGTPKGSAKGDDINQGYSQYKLTPQWA